VSREIDLTANGSDDFPIPRKFGGGQIMLDMVVAQSPTIGGDTGKNEVRTVFRVGARPNEGSIKTVFRLINDTPVTDSVIDTTGCTLPGNAVAIKLSNGHRIAFDGRNEDGGYGRYLQGNSGFLQYISPNGTVLNLNDAGDLGLAGTISAVQAKVTGLVNAANDAAAAGIGVTVGQFYRNGSVVMVRAA
jgi:hypothetical protein